MMNRAYIDAVRLLLEVAPEVFREPVFALKGGTAINLFLHDMPRLSVDLDLVYVDHQPGRDEALQRIGTALAAASAALESRGMRCARGSDAGETKLFVERDRVRVKIEVNHVFRGTVLPVAPLPLSEGTRNTFFTDIELPLLHPDELYGSKLVAAMDRQHPRDLFDVLGLYARDGLTPGIVECFVCYLAGHNRPVHEVLFANPIDIARAFANEFVGMTREPLALGDLLQVRNRLFAELPSALTTNQRKFLLGLVGCQPDWSLMRCPHLRDMSAIRWKLANLSNACEEQTRPNSPISKASCGVVSKHRIGLCHHASPRPTARKAAPPHRTSRLSRFIHNPNQTTNKKSCLTSPPSRPRSGISTL